MAKKISKHSRAARRLEIEEPEAKSLSSVSRAEKTDTVSAIIRATTTKNATLLNNKISKKNSKKPKNTIQSSNLERLKLERAMNLSDRLQDKIVKSKKRAKVIQATRKSNWDTINSSIMLRRDEIPSKGTHNHENDEDKMEEENFYTDDEGEENQKALSQPSNAFSLLNDEVEA